MTTLLNIIVLVASYLIGALPVGLLLVQITTGKDVRKVGSGRIGGTNVLRAAGPWVALLSVLGDIAKGLVPVFIARAVVGTPLAEALAALLAVVGHNYSIFIGFKGGAGTMTTGGGALALWPWNTPIMLITGIPMLVITRHASVGSITVAIVLPIIYAVRAGVGAAPWEHLIHGLGTMILTLWALRPNIKRLQEGTERRVSLRKST